MNININYEDPSFQHDEYEKVIDRVCEEAALVYGLGPNAEISILLCHNDYIHQLNKQYRNIDRPTDILTFVQEDDNSFPGMPAEEARVLGDMVISLSSMRSNAEAFGVSEDEELFRLLIHGVLHLLGENHETNEVEKEPMLQKQERLLAQLRGSQE